MRIKLPAAYCLFTVTLAAAASFSTAAPAAAQDWSAREVPVMTRNLYFGTSLDGVLMSTSMPQLIVEVTQAWQAVLATNFPERAEALADEIASQQPWLVGLQEAGAAGVVMFNRFYLPDLDLETLDVTPRVALSTPEEVRLPLRWTGILHEHLSMSIAASSGVHSGYDVAKLILAGADVAMTTSSLLRNGAGHLATIEEQLRDWMTEHDYESVDQMRGAVSRAAVADPAAYERANSIGNLASYTSSFLGGGQIPLQQR